MAQHRRPSRRHGFARLALPALLVAAAFSGWGCSSNKTLREFRMHPNPELAAHGMSDGQVKNKVALEADKQLRSAYDDLLRSMLLIDRRNLSYTPAP